MSVARERKSSIRQWALIGAEQRLVQLAEEAAAIHRAFPELRQRGGGGGQVPGPLAKPGRGRGRRRKRTMSADARRRISEAQKARWARQRAGGKKK
jgi:hypothetical protein